MSEQSERLYDILDLPPEDEAGALLAIEIPALQAIENLWGRQACLLVLGVTRHIIQSQIRDGDHIAQVRNNLLTVYAKNASLAQARMISERIVNALDAARGGLCDGIGDMMTLEIKGIAHVKRRAFEALMEKKPMDHVPANQDIRVLEKYAQHR